MSGILIFDPRVQDHFTYREFLSGYDLVFCKDASEARAAVSANTKKSDVDIAAAIVLWQPAGAEVLTDLLNAQPGLPVIAIDQALNPAIWNTAKALGAVEFLLKPLEEGGLRQAVQRALGEGSLNERVDELKKSMIGESRPWLIALENLARVIGRAEPVLILGDSGTGKELAARAVHKFGGASAQPFVAINAAAVQPHLLESELFGHEKGAFTDARESRKGVFEQCERGTLFLDEIGELPDALQAKLLRVIQERTFRRLGGNNDAPFRGRLVFASNKKLAEEVGAKRFRTDLYHRINVHEIKLPPLRERRGDWLLLAHYFLDKHEGNRQLQISQAARFLLADYPWPGNVRELENAMLHCLSHQPVEQVLPSHLPQSVLTVTDSAQDAANEEPSLPPSLLGLPYQEAMEVVTKKVNHHFLPRFLNESRGNITAAAERAGLSPKTFRARWVKAELPPLNRSD
jgi:DNA-binding NtrC family response regulator